MLCHRGNDTTEALKFMKIAQDVMREFHTNGLIPGFLPVSCYVEHSESLVEKLGNELNYQYQELLRMRTSSTCDGNR